MLPLWRIKILNTPVFPGHSRCISNTAVMQLSSGYVTYRLVNEGKPGGQRRDVRQNYLPEERQRTSFDCWVRGWWEVHHPRERRQKGITVLTDVLQLVYVVTSINHYCSLRKWVRTFSTHLYVCTIFILFYCFFLSLFTCVVFRYWRRENRNKCHGDVFPSYALLVRDSFCEGVYIFRTKPIDEVWTRYNIELHVCCAVSGLKLSLLCWLID